LNIFRYTNIFEDFRYTKLLSLKLLYAKKYLLNYYNVFVQRFLL